MSNTKSLLKYHLDLKIVVVAVLYYISARLGYFLAFSDTTALPTWPPSGIAFALIILLGRSSWPGITIGALVANIMAYWNNASLGAQTIIATSTFIAIGQTLEAVLGNFLMKRWIQDDYPFKNTKNAFRFLFVTLLMCMVGSSMGTISLVINGVIHDAVTQTALSWWVGNVVGILLFTPFLLSVSRRYSISFNTDKIIEITVFLVGVIGIFFLLRVEYLHEIIERALPFLLLPFLLWLAFRFDLVVAITGVLAASLFAIYLTVSYSGPFVLQSGSYFSMLLLQIFIGVISISTIILSATVKERMVAQRELELFNENLEAIVEERTKELNDEVETRRKAEEKIQRTNKELSKRNTELDNFVYSVSHDLRAPIASVLGLINLAKKDNDVYMKDTYLDMINNSALQQDHFIKEILDQSRNSRLEVKREEIFFEPLINDTFNQLKFATSTDNKLLQKEISVNQQQAFYSDSWRLKVILNNIISNSIRYRNGKDPVIKVEVAVSSETVRLSIQDNGKGIAKEHLKHIYKMFYRATDDGAGSGLGLYIVKEAVDKLGGSIDIESEEGEGTIVKLEIPSMVSDGSV